MLIKIFSSQNVLEFYLGKGFCLKNAVLGDFAMKSKSCLLFVVVFVCFLAGWESYMTPRRPIGVKRGRGGSHRESSLLPIGRLRVLQDSQPHGYALFL
jgi:hypothetical protein